MDGTNSYDVPTNELPDDRGFPEPVAVVSLRDAVTFRDRDEDGEPILIITDGVTTIALSSGLSGLSFGVVSASHRLAAAVHDFAQSISARWQKRQASGDGPDFLEPEAPVPARPAPIRPDSARTGRHRRNRRQIPVRRGNSSNR